MLSNVVHIVHDYFRNIPGLPLCRHISQYTRVVGQSESWEEDHPDTRAEYINCSTKHKFMSHG